MVMTRKEEAEGLAPKEGATEGALQPQDSALPSARYGVLLW